jgi:hypothetical protein
MDDCLWACCVLLARGRCDGLIPCPEKSYGCVYFEFFCVVSQRSLRRADPSSRGVLWMIVFVSHVLLARGRWDGLIPPPEESYRVYVCVCVWVCSGATVTLFTYE